MGSQAPESQTDHPENQMTEPIVRTPPTHISEPDWDTAEDRLRQLRERLARDTRSATAADRVADEIAVIVTRRVKNLAAIRRARELTQQQMADALGIQQADVSKLERRSNLQLATLARFIEAAGGHLRIVADFGDDQVEVEVDDFVS